MRFQGPGRSWTWRLGLTIGVMALAAACSSAAGHTGSTATLDGHRTAIGSVVLDGSPGTPAADTRTGTLYVPIQCTTSFCSPDKPARVMDVINAATCNATARSGCRVVARAAVGNSPTAAVVDDKTGTVYVTNSNDGTVSVVNGARCNARVTSGCGMPRATIKLGGFLVAAAVNPATRTLYAADLKGGVFVIDAAACNAVTTRGCAQPARKIKDSQGPAALDIDLVDQYRLRGQQRRLGQRRHRVGDQRGHLQRDARQRLRPGPAHHQGRQRRLLGRRGPGPPHRLRRQRQRRNGLGHQRRPLQRPRHLGLRQHVADGDDRSEPRIRGARSVLRHGLRGQSCRRHAVRHQHRDVQRHDHIRLRGPGQERAGHTAPEPRI